MAKKLGIEKKTLRIVRETIARYGMFVPGDAVLVAVSGGPDSVALVHLLYVLAGEYSLKLGIAHLNHSLRGPESDRDAAFVAALARDFNLPLFVEKKDVPAFQRRWRLSPEEAARKARYEFYDAVASKHRFNKIALGHHADDNAELVLMNLLRGSGPLGLSGMTPVRDDKFVRPLIGLRRSEILDYISENKIAYVTDSSNQDPAYRRNKIRHHLIPELQKSYNPAVVDCLNRLGEILSAEDQWIADAIEPVFADCVLNRGSNHISLALPRINAVDLAVGRRIIRKAIVSVKQDLRRITFWHVDTVIEFAKKAQPGGSLNLPGGLRVRKSAEALTIKKEGREASDEVINYRYTLAGEGTTLIKEADAAIKLVEIGADEVPDFGKTGESRAFFDRDCVRFPLVVRNFRPGDRFSPLGLDGTQKLKKFFSDHKISIHQRKKCPLLLSGKTIIWVAGHRIDNSVRLSPQTQRVLMAELLLA
jgi:tRNA(Ile)-lysidine synthase